MTTMSRSVQSAFGSVVRAFGISVTVSLFVASCSKSKPSTECPPQIWSGQCALVGVTKVEDKELPVPHVVYEARYRPQRNSYSPNYTPPEVTRNFWVASEYDLDLRDHLQRHRLVSCGLPSAPAGSCNVDKVAVSVPEFDVAAAQAKHREPQISGCAKIEAASEQDKLALGQKARNKISETMMFEPYSAVLSPDARAAVAGVAQRLKATPAIECIGVVGQTTTGEPMTLAAERARAVRDLLVSLGVQEGRILTTVATTNVFGAGAKPADPDPNQRKVGISVLLETAEPQAATR